MNILLVEDHIEMREYISDLLAMKNYTVMTAENGKAAIKLLAVYKFDLIITDIIMPEIEGIEFILRLRQSHIPIISISGLSKDTVLTELMSSLGIIGFIQKPFKSTEIVEIVEKVEKDLKSKV